MLLVKCLSCVAGTFQPEHRETKVYDGRVECVDMAFKLEEFVNPSLPSLLNHKLGEVLKNAIVALLVGFTKVATRHRFPHSEVVKFAAVSFRCHYEVSQTLTIGQLSEHHRKQLIPTRKTLDVLVTFALRNYAVELTAVHKLI